MDDKKNNGRPDRKKINVQENYEVEYWTKGFGVSKEELEKGVHAVGTSAEKVRQHLNA